MKEEKKGQKTYVETGGHHAILAISNLRDAAEDYVTHAL